MKRIRDAVRRRRAANAGDRNTPERVARLEREIAELRSEIDELRRDSARIAELYDLVFDRLRERRD
ncbi:putative RNase H-like nuclease (RuvC/YqgF family) [Agromyces flavus]|uniref:RNase H-like nuclease (RuvC/YqgF family) n=1 Tax=Agromyces flavus TaxID=589382 RepID=A0A1H1UH26_9MICO|nr:hypothetical protein [Agromyces flavus]MCP2368220.1 putative RNase H-like nuclease (RuvC/YqgF family) [Agromyces flavus]GGI47680.1 hypothetical protein GCM10010932_23680 [Agromyces flavus]SDS71591.1 hypothetical protein SAMN04489721_1782 [Agromyces flavus]